MKFLVFGFSVTGDARGYVERWHEEHAHKRPEYKICKVGLGGVQPDHGRHFFLSLIKKHRPDAIIVEFATASYRARPSSDFRRGDHRATILSLFQVCKETSIKCGILDFPLEGVDSGDDWVLEVDREYCSNYGVPLVERVLSKDILEDNVHPSERGKSIYANDLLKLFDLVRVSRPTFDSLWKVRRFEVFPVEDLTVSGGYFRPFARHGFEATVLALPADEQVSVILPQREAITGIVTIMSPKSGTMKVWTSAQEENIPSYDMFSYYERVIGRTLHKSMSKYLRFQQTPNIPDVVLRKGKKDCSPRVGGVTHVLYER